MADTIERTIYKLELDDSGYIRGVESLSASTKRFADQQEAANKRLLENEKALKTSGEVVEKNRKALESYTGTDKKYKEQLETTFKASQTGHEKLIELVANVRKGYESAKKAAEDFAGTAQRATNLQQGTTGGKIPTGPPLGIPSPVLQPPILPTSFGDFGLADLLAESNIEFEKLRTAIGNAEIRMNALNTEDEEFKLLAPIVEKGKIALQQFDEAAKKTGGSMLSLRTQIRQGRDELVRMEETGRGTSKEYIALEKNVARLTDAFGDQQARIKILASDTRALDFGKAAITSATSAFQAYTSISILAGDESAELQKKTMQLFAAMQLLTSLEQLANQVKRGGVLITNLQSAAQATYTAVVGASTGALRVFRLALLGTGIGAAAVLIGLLVSKYNDWQKSIKKVSEEKKLLNSINEKAVDGYAKEVSQLEVLRRQLNNLSIPQNERIRLAKEYNKTADEGNKLDVKQIDNIDLLNAAIDRQIIKIKERALAQAAANVTTEAATKLFQAEQKLSEVDEGFVLNLDKIDEQLKKVKSDFDSAAISFALSGKKADQQLSITLGKTLRALNDIKEANEEFTRAANLTAKLPGSIPPPPPDTKTGIAKKEIENEFARKKAELDAKLAELTRKEADNESKIRIEFAARLAKEQLEIERLLKEKKVTKPQAEILKAETIQINTLELDKALADFRKRITDAREKLNDELTDLQNKALSDSLNLIQEDFDRRAALIEFNEKKELADAKEATEDRINALDLQRLLIGEKAYQDAKAIIITNGEQEALNIVQRFAQARQDLAADIFKDSLDAFQSGLNQGLIARDEEIAKQIRAASDKFLAGKITFEQFQKDLTAIQKREEGIRRDATIANERSQLASLDRQIKATIDKTTKEYKDLLKLRDDYNKKLQADIQEDAVKDAEDTQGDKPGTDPRTQRIIEYAEAVGQLVDSVVSFWQKANEAESAALDKSIALQEKRVDAAQRIAERGNAQYLKQEEDRLRELQIKKENAARRELAINAALQASQLLVGITGAIAKIATPGIGIAETIGAISVIFAALATGYGLVKSLQGSQPKLAEGTTYVARGKNKPGKDTIPAWLNEGEAVIPERKNRNYKKSVEAIYHGKVPADVLNTFVENYVTNKTTKSDSFVNKYTKNADERKTLNTVEDVLKVVNNRLSNKKDISEKYSEVTDKVFAENKSSVENKNVADLVSKVFNQVSDRKISINELTSFINSKHEYNNTVDDIYRVVNEITDKRVFKDSKKSTEENIVSDIHRIVDKNITINQIKDFINKESFVNTYTKNKDEREALSVVKDVFDIVNNRLSKTIVQSDLKTGVESDFKSDIKTYSDLKNYSDVTDRVFSENKSLVESKNIIGLVRRIVNEVSDKKISINELTSFVRAYKKDTEDKKVIETAMKIVTENKTVYDTTNERISTYKKFVDNVSKVDSNILNSFINNYEGKKYFKGTPDLKGKAGIDNIPIWASQGEAIIPTEKNKLYSPTVKAVFHGTIPAEHINNFVNNYHKTKAIPLPNYERIKEAAEQHTGHDGKMAALLSEQNRKIDENNDLQRQTIRALKSMGVNVNMDRNGIALSVMEVVEQIKIDRRS